MDEISGLFYWEVSLKDALKEIGAILVHKQEVSSGVTKLFIAGGEDGEILEEIYKAKPFGFIYRGEVFKVDLPSCSFSRPTLKMLCGVDEDELMVWCYDNRKCTQQSLKLCDNEVSLQFEHEGGLEGYYRDTYSGIIECKDYFIEFSFSDVFCMGTDDFECTVNVKINKGDEVRIYEDEEEVIKGLLGDMNDSVKAVDIQNLRNYNAHETKTKGETTMALVNMNERTLKTYILVDEDKRLPVEKSLVHKFKNVMTEYDDETTIRQLLVDNDMNAIIEKHNKVRGETLNEEILQLNGSEVMLRPIKLKDLTWKCQ